MSAGLELGTFKRIATITISVVASGAPGPVGAAKIGTDTETSKDLYAAVAYSWVAA